MLERYFKNVKRRRLSFFGLLIFAFVVGAGVAQILLSNTIHQNVHIVGMDATYDLTVNTAVISETKNGQSNTLLIRAEQVDLSYTGDYSLIIIFDSGEIVFDTSLLTLNFRMLDEAMVPFITVNDVTLIMNGTNAYYEVLGTSPFTSGAVAMCEYTFVFDNVLVSFDLEIIVQIHSVP